MIFQTFAQSMINNILNASDEVTVSEGETLEVEVSCTKHKATMNIKVSYEEVDNTIVISIDKCLVYMFDEEFTMSESSLDTLRVPQLIHDKCSDYWYENIYNQYETNQNDWDERI